MRLFAAIFAVACLSSSQANAADIINYTAVPSTVGPDGARLVQVPARDKTHRRRMLVDFGLFGAGVHIGWLKPRNTDLAEDSGHHRFAVGSPILNVSAGTHALGLGTH